MNNRYVGLVYFSGTGGTRMITEAIDLILKGKGCETWIFPLDYQINRSFIMNREVLQKTDFLFVLYPVHAFDAPKPIYEWIEGLPDGAMKKTIVLSVSGGGDVAPNKHSRSLCIQALEEKSYQVMYERMLVMPSNFAVTASDDMNMWLLKSISSKVNQIVTEIMVNKTRRIEIGDEERQSKSIFQRLQPPVDRFGLSLFASEACNSCGWCAARCPRLNISMVDGRPVFSDQCIMCMRCVYGCPQNAIESEKYGFAIVKTGFDLIALEEKMKDRVLKPIEDLEGGILWFGVKRYLREE